MPAVLVLTIDPVGRDLIALTVHHDRDRTMLQTGINRFAKQRFDLQWLCRSGDIPVLRRSSKHGVPHAATDCVRFVSMLLQRIYDPDNLLRHCHFIF